MNVIELADCTIGLDNIMDFLPGSDFPKRLHIFFLKSRERMPNIGFLFGSISDIVEANVDFRELLIPIRFPEDKAPSFLRESIDLSSINRLTIEFSQLDNKAFTFCLNYNVDKSLTLSYKFAKYALVAKLAIQCPKYEVLIFDDLSAGSFYEIAGQSSEADGMLKPSFAFFGYECFLCSDAPANYAIQCGHIVCLKCFDKCVREKGSCPFCQETNNAPPLKLNYGRKFCNVDGCFVRDYAVRPCGCVLGCSKVEANENTPCPQCSVLMQDTMKLYINTLDIYHPRRATRSIS